MGGHKKKGSSFGPAVPTPIADYNVTGELFPDATCNYLYTGKYGGKPYYRREDGAYFIWWYTTENEWVISPELGIWPPGGAWYRIDPSIVGQYTPFEALGDAFVSAGSH